MSIANRKSNGFIESPKIIDEQNVLKSTSTSKLNKHQRENEAGNCSRFHFSVAALASSVDQIFSRIKSWSHGGADVGLIPVVFIGRNLCDCQMSVTET